MSYSDKNNFHEQFVLLDRLLPAFGIKHLADTDTEIKSSELTSTCIDAMNNELPNIRKHFKTSSMKLARKPVIDSPQYALAILKHLCRQARVLFDLTKYNNHYTFALSPENTFLKRYILKNYPTVETRPMSHKYLQTITSAEILALESVKHYCTIFEPPSMVHNMFVKILHEYPDVREAYISSSTHTHELYKSLAEFTGGDHDKMCVVEMREYTLGYTTYFTVDENAGTFTCQIWNSTHPNLVTRINSAKYLHNGELHDFVLRHRNGKDISTLAGLNDVSEDGILMRNRSLFEGVFPISLFPAFQMFPKNTPVSEIFPLHEKGFFILFDFTSLFFNHGVWQRKFVL